MDTYFVSGSLKSDLVGLSEYLEVGLLVGILKALVKSLMRLLLTHIVIILFIFIEGDQRSVLG